MAGNEIVSIEEFNIEYEAKTAYLRGRSGERVYFSIPEYNISSKTKMALEDFLPFVDAAIIAGFGGNATRLPPFVAVSEFDNGVNTYRLNIPAIRIDKYPMNFKKGDTGVMIPVDFGVVSEPYMEKF